MTNHVYVVDSCPCGKIVLEEDAFEFVIDKRCTIVEPRTSPRIIGATLELATGLVRAA